MLLAYNKIIPPKEWCHDPLLENEVKDTVAIILINKNILPPKEWEYAIQMHKIFRDSSIELLSDNGYILLNDYYVPPDFIKKEISNDTCQLCFN